MRSGPADLVAGFVSAVADELGAAVDNHLGSVDAAVREGVGVLLLAAGEIGGGERIGPAEAVPVIDVLFESQDFDAIEGLFLAEFIEQGIRGRATGAALRCEEFKDDGLLIGGVRGGGGMRRPANRDGDHRENGGGKRERDEELGAHGVLLTSIGGGKGGKVTEEEDEAKEVRGEERDRGRVHRGEKADHSPTAGSG